MPWSKAEQKCEKFKKRRYTLKGLENSKVSMDYTVGNDAHCKMSSFMRFCDSQGKGGHKSKDSPLPGTVFSP